MQKNIDTKRSCMQNCLAQIIKKYREKSKKSISLISNEINMTKSMWADLEKGIKDPQLSTVWRIAEALNMPVSKIIIKMEKELGENFSFIENNSLQE